MKPLAVPLSEQRILLQKSGNRCAFRGCRKILTASATLSDRAVVLGEVAHMVAESANGPRGDSPMPLAERNRYPNLILLCTLHHQLVDGQPQTYTVERLQGMRDDHEKWVEGILGRSTNGHGTKEAPAWVVETIHSSLLRVQRIPKYVYGVECPLARDREVKDQMRTVNGNEMAPFILRAGMLFTFQNLNNPAGPFADLVPGRSAERWESREWWNEAEQSAWFLTLANRSLNKLTGRQGLMLDKAHNRYYFQPEDPGTEFQIRYRPLNQKSSTRSVVWQPRRKSTGERVGYWYHRAVSLRFLRTGADDWCLAVRPDLHVTVDGVASVPSDKVGSRVTRKKSRMYNYDLLSEINFWRDYLSGSRPRILMNFGPRQNIVISTTLMRGDVTWPGIPEEHAKPFKNVGYIDDLFSWGELAELDVPGLDWDEDDDGDQDDDSTED